MKIKFILLLGFWALLFSLACKNDEIAFTDKATSLKFSKDTVFCDTVYHQTRSETYAVKVYNKEDKDIVIPKINLEGRAASPYRINVDGKSGYEFQNIPLRKKDSLFIFIEIAPTAKSTQAIAEDRINFPDTNQHITLFSVVQDAEYFIESKNNPNIISQNTTWNNNKAKIIYGNLTLAEGKSLNIEAGTKIYFTKNSSLSLTKNSQLNIKGELGKEVILRGDRNETKYDTIPMNWKGIVAESNSQLNINYAKIFGGETGLKLKNSNAKISNTIIHTFQKNGIETISSTLNAYNLVMNNCGYADLGIYKGGDINITHSSLANYWAMNSSTPAWCLYATNEYSNNTSTEFGELKLSIKNSILYGNKASAVFLKPNNGEVFNYSFESSILKHSTDSGFTFEGNKFISNSFKNIEPKFKNTNVYKMNLSLKDDSPAKGKANSSVSKDFPFDILGINRANLPSIGAYQ